MERHFLVAVSGDRTASYNLRFIKTFFSEFCDLRLTLLYVAPRPPGIDSRSILKPEQAQLAMEEQAKKKQSHKALEEAYEYATYHACDPDKVKKKVVHSMLGTVGEIIREGHDGLYDAVVLGRRGLSWFEEMVSDSVSHQILWNEIDFPIWVCRRPLEKRQKNVLLCVDGSTASERVADHVGFALGEDPGHKVTLFHVRESSSRLDDATRGMMDQAAAALTANGFAEADVEYKVVRGKKIPEAIMAEAEAGDYGVVAAGRTSGGPQGLKQRIFPGSVTTQLLRRLENQALWVNK